VITRYDTEQILFEVASRRRELEAAAEQARLVREVRAPHRMRWQVGGWLIWAGEALRWEEHQNAA
jgi:hypothetical protein